MKRIDGERSSISASQALCICADGVMHHLDDVFEVAQHEIDPSHTAARVGQEHAGTTDGAAVEAIPARRWRAIRW
ncbi:hypothetical protein L2221_26450, partial [Xanthomonas perforans]|nr:hypothetical protein [Xanthomonas perforans]